MFEFVKKYDDEFPPKPSSEIVNADATPKVMYHVTSSQNGEFYSFATDGFTYPTVYFEDSNTGYYKITLSIGHNGNVATIYNFCAQKRSQAFSRLLGFPRLAIIAQLLIEIKRET